MEIKKDWKYNDTVTEYDLNRIEKNIEENFTKKVQKIDGKGLSENDFTNENKKKLDELENYDDSEIKSEIKNMRIGAIGGGKNLFDARIFCKENPKYYTYSGNGCIYITDEDTRSTGFISAIKLDAGTYTISGFGNSVKLWNGSSFIESETFTLTRTTFLFPKFLGTGKKIYPQIDIGSTATDFEEFISSNKIIGEEISGINDKLSNSMIIDMVLGGYDTNTYLPVPDESMQAIISKDFIKVTPNTKYRIKRDGLDYSTDITIKCIGYSDIDIPITDGVEVFLNDNCGLIKSTPNIGWIEFTTTPTTEYISVGITVNDATRRPTLECLGVGQAVNEIIKNINVIEKYNNAYDFNKYFKNSYTGSKGFLIEYKKIGYVPKGKYKFKFSITESENTECELGLLYDVNSSSRIFKKVFSSKIGNYEYEINNPISGDLLIYLYVNGKLTISNIELISMEISKTSGELINYENQLKYGEKSGNFNILKNGDDLLRASGWTKTGKNSYKGQTSKLHEISSSKDTSFFKLNYKSNTPYTISFDIKFETTNANIYLTWHYSDGTISESVVKYGFKGDGRISATSDINKTCYGVKISYANSSVVTISNIQIEEGAETEYSPYIPSINMLSNEVKSQKDSLEDYGFDNKFDGQWLQGGYVQNGQYDSNYSYIICNKNKIQCNAGDLVEIKYAREVWYMSVRFYDESGNVTEYKDEENVSKVSYKVPANTVALTLNIQYSTNESVTPNSALNCIVYVNNDITVLKNNENTLASKLITLKKGVYLGDSGDFNGNITDFMCSADFEEISPNCPIKLELSYENSDYSLLFYDKNKNYLGRNNSLFGLSGNKISGITPNNAYYATISIRITNNTYPNVFLSSKKIGNEVDKINRTLEDYGFTNYFDGELINDAYSTIDGNLTGLTNYICNKNPIFVNSKNVSIKLDEEVEQIIILMYRNSGYVTQKTATNTNEMYCYISENISYINFDIMKTGINKDVMGHIGVYIENEIDNLKKEKHLFPKNNTVILSQNYESSYTHTITENGLYYLINQINSEDSNNELKIKVNDIEVTSTRTSGVAYQKCNILLNLKENCTIEYEYSGAITCQANCKKIE